MKKNLILMIGAVGSLFLSGCATQTLENRISQRPDVFEKLPAAQKASITTGQVTNGMTRDAVYFAWGKPDQIQKGSVQNSTYEAWTYVGQQPVFVQNTGFYGGYGHGYPYSRRRYYDPGPSVTYVPYVQRIAEFTNGKLSKWKSNYR